jgi:hypothetical protein
MIVSEGDDRKLFDRVQEQNLIRQYDLLTNCIEIGLRQGHTALDKYTLWALNHVAVANISQFGGRFRGRAGMSALAPLLGDKRTRLGHCETDAVDPGRTFPAENEFFDEPFRRRRRVSR